MRFLRTIGLVLLAGFMLASPSAWAEATQSVSAAAVKPTQSRALSYLESLKGKAGDYLAPSQIDQRYNLALYVNAKASGPNAQRMWVLQRDQTTGRFKLALWDDKWWKSKKARTKYKVAEGDEPPFSWLVSIGKKWRGDNRSGPTSLGVFALDERKGRMQRGWHAPGMIHAMYLDLHYRSGRRSGIAFHGTTRSQYRKLGRIASHGCIRMHQSNALKLLNRVRGADKVLARDDVWGEVPRFWRRQKGGNRYGYVRDGSLLHGQTGRTLKVASAKPADGSALDVVLAQDSETQTLPALTKTGFRAITVIFKD